MSRGLADHSRTTPYTVASPNREVPVLSKFLCFMAGTYVGVVLHRFRVIYVPHEWDRWIAAAIRRLRGRRGGAA